MFDHRIILAGEFIEFFTELMFGSGAWFGLIIILAICFLGAWKAKYSAPLWILILLFMGFQYLEQIGDEISVTNNFAWSWLIAWMGAGIIGFIFYQQLNTKK